MLVSDISVIKKVLEANGETVWKFVNDYPQLSHSSRAVEDELLVNSGGSDDTLQDSEDLSLQDEVVQPNNATSKKKKKKSKKKGGAKSSNQIEYKSTRRISWGFVDEILFSRDLSYGSIPRSGIYPLGLGIEEGRQRMSVNEYIQSRRIELWEKSVSLGITFDGHPVLQEIKLDELSEMNLFPMETRQFDYKMHGSQNPLFGYLNEDERLAILNPILSSHKDKSHSHEITRLHHDIRLIQTSRDKQNLGCNCKHIKVDKLSLGKMKSELQAQGHLIGLNTGNPAHTTDPHLLTNDSVDLLSSNTATNIIANNTTSHSNSTVLTKVDIGSLSKTEITSRMKELLKVCALCTDSKCECVQLELPCSSEICGCLKHGYRPGQQQVCGNALGRSIFDPETVHSYRMQFVTTGTVPMTCKPTVESANSTTPTAPHSSKKKL